MADPFISPQAAALALLNSGQQFSRRAGSFLGQTAVDTKPLSQAQTEWLVRLLDRAGLPPLEQEGRA